MDPMVGSGCGGRSHVQHSVGVGGVAPFEENSNSNVISLLEVCFLCNRRFLYDLSEDPTSTQDCKEEDFLLKLFFEDNNPFEKLSLLQCCSFCKELCNHLIQSKKTLSSLIDEVSTLLRKSKKLVSSSSYMLSKPRVVTRLFQEQEHNFGPNESQLGKYLGNLNLSTIPIQIQIEPEDEASNSSAFPIRTQFNLVLDPDPSTPTACTPDKNAETRSFEFPKVAGNRKGLKDTSLGNTVLSKKKKALMATMTSTSSPSKKEKNSVIVSHSSAKLLVIKDKNQSTVNSLINEDQDARDGQSPAQTFSLDNQSIPSSSKDPQNENQVQKQVLEPTSQSKTSPKEKETFIDATKNNECSICQKTFKTKRDLKSHEGVHNQEKPFNCDECGASYRQKKALKIHLGLHKGEAKFECEICKKTFTQKIALTRHQHLHNEGAVVYQCDLCGKGFIHHSSFAHHKLTHSGVRKFQCRICDQQFFTSSHLKRHFRTHTGERPFKCEIAGCDKAFNEKSNLKVHQRFHTKVARYNCTQCGKGFERQKRLNEHVQKIHTNHNVSQDIEETARF